MNDIAIRPAELSEADALSDLCRRSKAHWGYDAAFMAASRDALTITPAMISRGQILVAVNPRADVLGVASAEPLDAKGTFDLGHMFIEPRAIGTGAGSALFAALVALLRQENATRLMILSDPHAEKFYLRMGARRVGEAPSDAIPGRKLPLLEYVIE